MDSKKAYELMKEEYIDKEASELCNQIEKSLERIISYDDGMLDDIVLNKIKTQAIKLLKEWHL
tara:strand:- start:461 stop:649 length:189 start_codon:yes stop_codon:yes gene_type:complete